MISNAAKPPSMSAQTYEPICEIHRYRALTPSLLRQLSAGKTDGLEARLRRAVRNRWLSSIRLAEGDHCYALGPKGFRHFGVHYRSGFPFESHGLLQHIGIATFCAAARYRRLQPDEFKSLFPTCHRPGQSSHAYCIDQDNPNRLAWVIVDHGARAFRFYEKAKKVLSQRLPLAGFQQLLDESRFCIVVLTATAEKASQIDRSFQAKPCLSATVTTLAIPDLLQFAFNR